MAAPSGQHGDREAAFVKSESRGRRGSRAEEADAISRLSMRVTATLPILGGKWDAPELKELNVRKHKGS